MPVPENEETDAMIAAAQLLGAERYVLRLYVAGMTQRSHEAIRRVLEFCDKHLADRYELQIIDIYQKPDLLRDEQIVAVPTLVKRLPAPLRRFIGDMQSEERLLHGMDLARAEP